jgi:hypothetical protein
LPNFLPITAQNLAWLGTVGDSGAGLTLHHHSLDPHGGHGMVQLNHGLSHASEQQHEFSQKFAAKCQIFVNHSLKL